MSLVSAGAVRNLVHHLHVLWLLHETTAMVVVSIRDWALNVVLGHRRALMLVDQVALVLDWLVLAGAERVAPGVRPDAVGILVEMQPSVGATGRPTLILQFILFIAYGFLQ